MNAVSFGIFFVSCYLLILWLAMRWRGKMAQSPWLRLLRGFFPSWHFFDKLGHKPVLQMRAKLHEENWSAWSSFHPQARRSWRGLFYQPDVCEQLYQQSLVDQLAVELTDPSTQETKLLESSVYLSVQALAQSLAKQRWPLATAMQFRLLLIDPLTLSDHPLQICAFELDDDDERLVLRSESLAYPEAAAPLRAQPTTNARKR